MLLNIEGIEVEFPYSAYDCQITFIRKVLEAFKKGQNAVLESPTGTGKTLCLLCGALAYVKDVKSKLTVNVGDAAQGTLPGSLFPKILYASRTHSQLSQVVRELNKTLYKDTKTVTLGSRDVLCINEKVMSEANSVTKAFMCRNLVKLRKCYYYNEFEKLDNSTMDLLYIEKGGVPDIEDFISISKKNRICPFYRTRSAFETAELILLPYNYIIDPRLRRIHNVQLKGNIIIFDEAHNLEAICEESVSASLSSLDISGSIRECKAVLEGLINDEEEIRAHKDACEEGFREEIIQDKVLLEKNDVAHLLAMLQNFENMMDKFYKTDESGRNLRRSDGKVYSGQKMMDLLAGAEICRDIRDGITLLIDRMGQYLAHKANSDEGSGVWSVKSVFLHKFACFVSAVYADNNDETLNGVVQLPVKNKTGGKENCADNFQLFVTTVNNSIVFNYWCFTPSLAMRLLCKCGVRSLIVTSGTLSPLDTFIAEMGIDIPVQLQNGHVAGSNQILTACIRADPYNNVLCGSFNNRNTDNYLSGVGNAVVRACSLVPQGVIVFFSSYSLMYLCLKRWKKPGGSGFSLFNEICKIKKIFVEPKSKTELKLILQQYKEAVSEGNGAALFAVCRAKVSEGIDFADCESRAVIVIGIPYAPITDPRVELKRQFLSTIKSRDKKLSRKIMNAEEWYQTDAVRAVNQAIGRVLRHKDDFGVVILADSRFCTMNQKLLPLWLQGSVKCYNTINDLETECVEFFKKHRSKVQKFDISRSKELVQTKTVRKRIIVIDDDEEEEDIFIKGNRLIKDLYTGDEMNSFKNSRLDLVPEKSSEAGNVRKRKLEEIDMMSEANGFDKLEAVKRNWEKGPELFRPVQPSVVNRKKIKLKPNSRGNEAILQTVRRYLDAICKTPKEFSQMLHEKSEVCRRKVKIALKDYSTNRNINSFIDKITAATLPDNLEVFLAVYGFLNDEHKDEFASACNSLKLIKL